MLHIIFYRKMFSGLHLGVNTLYEGTVEPQHQAGSTMCLLGFG